MVVERDCIVFLLCRVVRIVCMAAVAAMVAKGVKLTATGYEYPTDYTGPHLPEPTALPSDDSAALAVVSYGGFDDASAAASASGYDASAYAAAGYAGGYDPAAYAAYYGGGGGYYDASGGSGGGIVSGGGDDARATVGKGKASDGGDVSGEGGAVKRARVGGDGAE